MAREHSWNRVYSDEWRENTTLNPFPALERRLREAGEALARRQEEQIVDIINDVWPPMNDGTLSISPPAAAREESLAEALDSYGLNQATTNNSHIGWATTGTGPPQAGQLGTDYTTGEQYVFSDGHWIKWSAAFVSDPAPEEEENLDSSKIVRIMNQEKKNEKG